MEKKSIFLLVLCGVAALTGCKNAFAPKGDPALTVTIQSPVDGSTVGTSFTALASVSGSPGIAGLLFFLDGAAVGSEDTAAPYTAILRELPLGDHALFARARTAANASLDSATVRFRGAQRGPADDPPAAGG